MAPPVADAVWRTLATGSDNVAGPYPVQPPVGTSGSKTDTGTPPTCVSAEQRHRARSLPSWSCGFDSRHPLSWFRSLTSAATNHAGYSYACVVPDGVRPISSQGTASIGDGLSAHPATRHGFQGPFAVTCPGALLSLCTGQVRSRRGNQRGARTGIGSRRRSRCIRRQSATGPRSRSCRVMSRRPG
jgi:hypothetical protein